MKFTKIKLLIAALALGGTVAAAPVAHAETLTVGTTAQTYPTSYKKRRQVDRVRRCRYQSRCQRDGRQGEVQGCWRCSESVW